jgi:Type II CAAX prenyl endopeptidase Rce1-like
MRTPTRSAKRVGSYWEASRSHRYSLLFALPLLLMYEVLAALLAVDPVMGGVRNGADVLLKSLFVALGGNRGPLLFMAVVVGISLWLVSRDLRARGGRLEAWVFGGMVAESAVLSLAFGLVVATLTIRILGPLGALATQVGGQMEAMSWPQRLMLSIGAGLYEELLFRVVIVAAIANGARLAFGWGRGPAGAIATILGALIFATFHYIGPYGDDFALQSFTFRSIAGVLFSALYLTRGFGITAWTHAMYDVLVLMVWT